MQKAQPVLSLNTRGSLLAKLSWKVYQSGQPQIVSKGEKSIMSREDEVGIPNFHDWYLEPSILQPAHYPVY